jgi:hypothetical protein
MSHWVSIVPKENGFYFYRPSSGMQAAIVVRTPEGFLFPGVERAVPSREMPGQFWDQPITLPPD